MARFNNVFFIFVGMAIVFAVAVVIQPSDSGIPPTDAFERFTVETSPTHGTDTNVTADNYTQRIFFVSDGSILFNVTEVRLP